jgi:hypothetical protein
MEFRFRAGGSGRSRPKRSPGRPAPAVLDAGDDRAASSRVPWRHPRVLHGRKRRNLPWDPPGAKCGRGRLRLDRACVAASAPPAVAPRPQGARSRPYGRISARCSSPRARAPPRPLMVRLRVSAPPPRETGHAGTQRTPSSRQGLLGPAPSTVPPSIARRPAAREDGRASTRKCRRDSTTALATSRCRSASSSDPADRNRPGPTVHRQTEESTASGTATLPRYGSPDRSPLAGSSY